MNRLPHLNAGAVDLRLAGDQTQRGSYVQRRRNQMAYGGTPGADGRRAYGIGSVFQKAKDKFVEDIIPNELKENPMAAAALLGVGANYLDMIPGQMSSEGWIGDIIGGGQNLLNKGITGAKNIMGMGDPFDYSGVTGVYPPGMSEAMKISNMIPGPVQGIINAGANIAGPIQGLIGDQWQLPTDDRNIFQRGVDTATNWVKDQFGRVVDRVTGQPVNEQDLAQNRLQQQRINWEIPMAIGAGAGAYQKKYLEDQPPFPGDETGIKFQTAKQVMADPEQRFKPQEQYVLPSALAAEGGRIGYNRGRVVNPGGYAGDPEIPEGFLEDFERRKYEDMIDEELKEHKKRQRRRMLAPTEEAAQGGRIGYAEGDTAEVLGPVTPGKGITDIDTGDFNLSDLGEYTQMYGPEGAGGLTLKELIKKLISLGFPKATALAKAAQIMGKGAQDDDTGGWELREG